MTASTDRFSTTTLKVTVPPGSGTEPTPGDLVTETEGSTSVKGTVAVPLPVPGRPPPSCTVAVTVSRVIRVAGVPRPATASKEQERVPPAGMAAGCAGQVLFATAGLPASQQVAEHIVHQGDQGHGRRRGVARRSP